MKYLIISIVCIVTITIPSLSLAYYPSGQQALQPVLAVGEQSDGTYTAIKVDSDGVVQTA